MDNPTSYTVETETFTLNNPTHDNYEFVGWMGTDIDGVSKTVTIEKGSTGNRTYTAVWNVEVIIEASGNEVINTYSVSVYDEAGSTLIGTYTESFKVNVGVKYTFKVSGDVTSDTVINSYQILRIKLNDATMFKAYSPVYTGISESTIISKSEITYGTKISFEYLSAYRMTTSVNGYISGLTVTEIDDGNQVVISYTDGYIIAKGTQVNFTVNSTPTSSTVISAFIGFTFVANGTTSTIGVTGGGGIQFVNFTHNTSYTNDSDVGTYAYVISGNTEISSLTVNVVITHTVKIMTSAIPEGESITIESEHGLNKVIDRDTGEVMLYEGIWTVTATTLTLAELQQVFVGYTVTSTNGVITIAVVSD